MRPHSRRCIQAKGVCRRARSSTRVARRRDGWTIIAVHDSKESWERFRDDILLPRLKEGVKGGFPTSPQETAFEVHVTKASAKPVKSAKKMPAKTTAKKAGPKQAVKKGPAKKAAPKQSINNGRFQESGEESNEEDCAQEGQSQEVDSRIRHSNPPGECRNAIAGGCEPDVTGQFRAAPERNARTACPEANSPGHQYERASG